MRFFVTVFSCALLAIQCSFSRADSGSTAPKVVQRTAGVVELQFQSQATYPDPFNNAVFDVLFTDPAGKTLRVPGFWKGGKQWCVRYWSANPGTHHYKTECSNPIDKGLNAVSGEVKISPSNGANDQLKHGPLRVADDHRHLAYRDGKPFFWLADTWWLGLTKRLSFEDFQKLAADRKAKGFNVVLIVAGLYPDLPPLDPRGVNEAGLPWEKGYARIRPEYFDAADRRIEYLVDQGFTPMIVGAWGFHLPVMGQEKMQQHWRYLIARWGALPVVWCASGETTMAYYLERDPKPVAEKLKAGWSNIIRFIRREDPYHRLLTLHPSHMKRDSIDDLTLIDFYFHHSGHTSPAADHGALPWKEWRLKPTMPMINAENRYEGLYYRGMISTDDTRQAIWAYLVNSGFAGASYGVNGVWQANRLGEPHGKSPAGNNWGTLPWDQAMNLPGSTQMGYIRKFLNVLPWQDLVANPDLVTAAGGSEGVKCPFFCAAKDDTLRVVYMLLPETVDVAGLRPTSDFSLTWFDPRTGEFSKKVTVRSTLHGKVRIDPAGRKFQDWVVLVRLKSLQ